MNNPNNQQSLDPNDQPSNRTPFLMQQNYFSQHSYRIGLHPFSIQQSLITAARGEGKGKWSANQQSLYIKFLQENIDEMSSRHNRKTHKVFLKMSKIIPSRNPDQCRSHHQKILRYHSSLQDIIIRYQSRIKGENIKQKRQPKTQADEQIVSGFYILKRIDNLFSITIWQSAVRNFTL